MRHFGESLSSWNRSHRSHRTLAQAAKAASRALVEALESRRLLAGDGLSATYYPNFRSLRKNWRFYSGISAIAARQGGFRSTDACGGDLPP